MRIYVGQISIFRPVRGKAVQLLARDRWERGGGKQGQGSGHIQRLIWDVEEVAGKANGGKSSEGADWITPGIPDGNKIANVCVGNL